MDEPRVVADVLGEFGEEGDHVVLDLGLDRIDAGDAGRVVGEVALLPHRLGGVLRDHSERGLGVAGVGLDQVPDVESVFRLPDGSHGGTGIARNHGRRSFIWSLVPRKSGLAAPESSAAAAAG